MAEQETQHAAHLQQAAPENNKKAQSAPSVSAAATPLAQPEEDEKFFAALGYFAFLFVIPFLVKPKSEFCKFHAKQSMVLFVITLAVLIVLGLFPTIGSIFTLALFALYVLAIYRSYMGEWWPIPFVSKFAGKVSTEKLYEKAGLAVSGIQGLKEKAVDMAKKSAEEVKKSGNEEKNP